MAENINIALLGVGFPRKFVLLYKMYCVISQIYPPQKAIIQILPVNLQADFITYPNFQARYSLQWIYVRNWQVSKRLYWTCGQGLGKIARVLQVEGLGASQPHNYVSLGETNVLSAAVLLMSGCKFCFLCALDWMGNQAEQRKKKKKWILICAIYTYIAGHEVVR